MDWLTGGQSALLVVAHPDDETIFAGGLILTSENVNWTVVCATFGPEDQRGREFVNACARLGAECGNAVEPVLLGLRDGGATSEMLAPKLRPYSSGYDIVMTHNRMGENGHEDHKAVHQAVVSTMADANVWVFICPGATNVNQDELRSRQADANRIVECTPSIRQKKREVFHTCHGTEALKYGYDWRNQLIDSHLRPVLKWYFEDPGREEYSFHK